MHHTKECSVNDVAPEPEDDASERAARAFRSPSVVDAIDNLRRERAKGEEPALMTRAEFRALFQ